MLNPVPQNRLKSVQDSSLQKSTLAPQWSDSLQTMLDQPPSTLPLRLIVGGLAFCTCVGAWTWFGQINEVAHAQGKLIPKGEAYKVHSVETGRVAQVFVKEGQPVKEGQVLVQLEDELAKNDVDRLEKELASTQAELRQMQLIRDQSRIQANLQTVMAQEKTESHQVEIKQAESNSETTRSLITQLETDVTEQNKRLERLQPLVQEGAIAQEQVFSAEQGLRDRQRTITEHQGSLQKSLADVDRLKVELEQKQAEIQQVKLESEQQVQKLEVQITQQQAKVNSILSQNKTAKAKLKQRFVYAPAGGVISTLNIRHPGELLEPNRALAEISPTRQPLTLSAVLPNQEAGFVKPGMTVQLKFDAFPFQDYGIVPGKVTTISQDAYPDEKLGQVYRLEIQVEKNEIEHNQQKTSLKAGQTATAEIVTRQRRIIDVLLDPIKQLQAGMTL
jgi:hemolysin D